MTSFTEWNLYIDYTFAGYYPRSDVNLYCSIDVSIVRSISTSKLKQVLGDAILF